VDEAGFEGTANSQGKAPVSPVGAAKSGAVESQNHPEAAGSDLAPIDSDLAHIISAWPRLDEHFKAAIRMMVESATR